MPTSGVFIPFDEVDRFSPAFRAELAAFVQSQLNIKGDAAVPDDGEGPADLSVAQAKLFLDRVSDKVRAAIRVIAESDASAFTMADIMAALGAEDAGSLRGVWGGITKRVRTVVGETEAYLIWWTELETGWVGRVSPTTHRSLRKVLGL